VENRNQSKVGQHIRVLRHQRTLTQEQLAERCGLHWTYISSVERGQRNISLANIVKIARALQVKPKLLLETLD
jgi:transcriptional regulator with XRE-family HTH domain